MLCVVGYWTNKRAGYFSRPKPKRRDMEDNKIKLYEDQLRRLFKEAEQGSQEAPKQVPAHR
jgi:hypothetical protein